MHLNDKIYNEMFMQNFNTLCIHTKFQKSGLLLKWVLILHNALRVLKLLQNAENNKKKSLRSHKYDDMVSLLLFSEALQQNCQWKSAVYMDQ